jgi:hypothetical protein
MCGHEAEELFTSEELKKLRSQPLVDGQSPIDCGDSIDMVACPVCDTPMQEFNIKNNAQRIRFNDI